MKAHELDEKFDADDEEIIDAFDLTHAKRPNLKQKRVNVDFPVWMISALDAESARLGITRQSLIKMWIASKLDDFKN